MVMERLSPKMTESMKVDGATTFDANGYNGRNFLYRIKVLIYLNKDWKNLNNIKLRLTYLMKSPQ